MTETYKFIDVVKSLLVCACLCATLCSQCRQEQTSDKLTAEINTLRHVSDNISECVYKTQDKEDTPEDERTIENMVDLQPGRSF